MSFTDERYRKEMDLNDCERTLRSISPALSLHKTLTDKKRQLEAELRQMDEKRPPITLSKAHEKAKARRSASKKRYATKV